MSNFSMPFGRAIRIAAATALVIASTLGTTSFISGAYSPAEAKAKKKTQPVQTAKKSKGKKSGSNHKGGGDGAAAGVWPHKNRIARA
jgi:hypothetical protein